jgi:hypothetical protein
MNVVLIRHRPGVVGPSAIISSVSDVDGDRSARPEFGDGTLVSAAPYASANGERACVVTRPA